VANSVIAQLLFLQKENKTQDISMYINSPGGSVTAGLAIYDTMQFVQCPSRPTASVRRPPWAPSCSPPAPRASATRCRTRAS
jgi:hypothetical protein